MLTTIIKLSLNKTIITHINVMNSNFTYSRHKNRLSSSNKSLTRVYSCYNTLQIFMKNIIAQYHKIKNNAL